MIADIIPKIAAEYFKEREVFQNASKIFYMS